MKLCWFLNNQVLNLTKKKKKKKRKKKDKVLCVDASLDFISKVVLINIQS